MKTSVFFSKAYSHHCMNSLCFIALFGSQSLHFPFYYIIIKCIDHQIFYSCLTYLTPDPATPSAQPSPCASHHCLHPPAVAASGRGGWGCCRAGRRPCQPGTPPHPAHACQQQPWSWHWAQTKHPCHSAKVHLFYFKITLWPSHPFLL